MTKIDIVSGFLGAGKTTFIKKMLKESFLDEQVVLIENEFGEIGIDGGFLKDSGIQIREMNSGCICCSLVGDFGKSLKEVVDTYHPDRILIEPSGVGKLSDVIKAVQGVQEEIDAKLNSFITVVDVMKCRLYHRNFGEFFSNQITYAGAIILSRTDKAKQEKIEESIAILRELNKKAPIITTPIEQLSGEKLLETMEGNLSLEEELMSELACPICGDHHHDHHHPIITTPIEQLSGEKLLETMEGNLSLEEELMSELACPICGDHHHDHHQDHCECEHDHHHHDHCECEHDHHHHDHCVTITMTITRIIVNVNTITIIMIIVNVNTITIIMIIVDANTITIMRMKCLPAGVVKQRENIRKNKWKILIIVNVNTITIIMIIVDANTITIMRMKCLPAGVVKQRENIRKNKWKIFS